MPIQAPQWTDFRLCPVCQNEYNPSQKPPISLGCGHTICQSCLFRLSKQQCPFDQAEIRVSISKLPVNYALLSLVGGELVDVNVDLADVLEHKRQFDAARKAIEVLAQSLQNVVITGNSSSSNSYSTANGTLTRPMQRKLVALLHSQLVEEEGRSRAMRSARSIGERAVKELILMHQSPQTLSAALWAAVRQRGCQFLGPAMQDAVLRLILLSLEDGISLSRKVLVLFVVQRLEKQFTQASKTSIGHVVQLLYRASCFKVTKRDGDSSLLQLHEKYRTYSALRKEHDAQIVQIAMEAGLHISPEQWSALLYGDDEHKSHMQSIIDKLQTPASFASSIQELIIALQRTDDPHSLQNLRPHLDRLSAIDPNPEADAPTWEELEDSMNSLRVVVSGLQAFAKEYAAKNKGNIEGTQMINTKYRTSMCRDILQRNTCPRGANCNFAHSEEELERYRKRRHMPVNRLPSLSGNCLTGAHSGGSRDGSSGSPDSCSGGDLDDDLEVNGCCPTNQNATHNIPCIRAGNMHQHYQQATPGGLNHHEDGVLSDNFRSMNMVSYHQQQQQQPLKKEEVMQSVKVGGPPPSPYEVPMPPQPTIIPQRPNHYHHHQHQQQQQQVQYQPTHPFYGHTAPHSEVPRESTGNGGAGEQHTMYLQTNQQAYVAPNGHPMYPHGQAPVHQQQHPQPSQHHQHQQQVFQPYQGEYPGPYPNHVGFANQPFAHHYNMRTAIARGMNNNDDLLKSSATSELSLNIPSCKDTKEDAWKFGGSNKSSTSSLNSRIDSCLDSGRGSSIGYSSDTFSPLSTASAGSRGSPQSVPDNETTRKIWDDKIWAAPAESSSKLSTWSNSRPSSNNGWNFFLDQRLSDPEEQNTSSESVGKCHEGSVLEKQSSYSSMKDWPRSSDSRMNGGSESQGLLGLFPSGSPATKRPPPGFGLK